MGKNALGVFTLALLAALLVGCGGGMNGSEVEQSLTAFFGEIDQAEADAGTPPQNNADQLMQWTIDLRTRQVEIADRYLEANEYPDDIEHLLTQMRHGLAGHADGYRSWLERGMRRDKAPPEEVEAIDRTLERATEAEAELRDEAGL